MCSRAALADVPSTISVNAGGVSLEVVPETFDRPPRDVRECEAAAKVVEDGEFVFGEDICVGLRLNTLPDLADGSLQHGADGWVEWSVFTVSCNLQCSLDRKLIRQSVATHPD